MLCYAIFATILAIAKNFEAKFYAFIIRPTIQVG